MNKILTSIRCKHDEYSKSMVNKIHDNLFKNYEASTEKPERLGILRNLEKTDRVLEIGANRGGVTEVIAWIVEPKNFVAVEPSKKGIDKIFIEWDGKFMQNILLYINICKMDFY